jgi:hypothetical protein
MVSEAQGGCPINYTLHTTNPLRTGLGCTPVFLVEKYVASRLSLRKERKSPSLYLER